MTAATKARVRRHDSPTAYVEVEVDADSRAAQLAASGLDAVWKPIPPTVRVRNPQGAIHSVHEDHPCVALAKSKKDGWSLVKDGETPEPEPRPVVKTVWLVHPQSFRLVKVTAASEYAAYARAGDHGWKFASPEQVERRLKLGSNYNANIDEKEF